MDTASDRWTLFLTLQAHGELTDQQRAALWFVRCCGESYDRAGVLLGASRHTVHRRLVEGEQALKPA